MIIQDSNTLMDSNKMNNCLAHIESFINHVFKTDINCFKNDVKQNKFDSVFTILRQNVEFHCNMWFESDMNDDLAWKLFRTFGGSVFKLKYLIGDLITISNYYSKNNRLSLNQHISTDIIETTHNAALSHRNNTIENADSTSNVDLNCDISGIIISSHNNEVYLTHDTNIDSQGDSILVVHGTTATQDNLATFNGCKYKDSFRQTKCHKNK